MPDNTGTQALWPQMIAALAAIDDALGLPDDGCNSTAQTLDAIRQLRADLVASQAREAQLREALRLCSGVLKEDGRDATVWLAQSALESTADDAALREMIEVAKAEEREACARISEDDEHKYETGRCCAIAIRARGDK